MESESLIDWNVELPKIEAAARIKGLDPAFIRAIRAQENGPADNPYGDRIQGFPGYDEELKICCNTVAHRLASYTLNPLIRDSFGNIRYTTNWIAYFASIWAPIGANNDPNELNKNWFPDVCKLYLKFRGE